MNERDVKENDSPDVVVVSSADSILSQLNTPEHDMDGSDEINQTSGPFVHEDELIVPDLNQVGSSEESERRGLGDEKDTEREKGKRNDTETSRGSPPRLLDSVVENVSLESRSGQIPLGEGLGEGIGRIANDIVRTDEGQENSEDPKECDAQQLGVRWKGERLAMTFA